MVDQLDAFAVGAASRTSDPSTSKAAAASVKNQRASHRRVLAMFKLYGDMTDEQLAESIHDAEKDAGLTKLMSPSGVRSRRSELSKPNMDRIEEMLKEMGDGIELSGKTLEKVMTELRARLLIEGLRSPLWDTGKRATLASGRSAIVWGIAS